MNKISLEVDWLKIKDYKDYIINNVSDTTGEITKQFCMDNFGISWDSSCTRYEYILSNKEMFTTFLLEYSDHIKSIEYNE